MKGEETLCVSLTLATVDFIARFLLLLLAVAAAVAAQWRTNKRESVELVCVRCNATLT